MSLTASTVRDFSFHINSGFLSLFPGNAISLPWFIRTSLEILKTSQDSLTARSQNRKRNETLEADKRPAHLAPPYVFFQLFSWFWIFIAVVSLKIKGKKPVLTENSSTGCIHNE